MNIQMIEEKNELRKERISASLKNYFLTEKGREHRKKLSALQRTKMSKYNEYLKGIEQ